MCGAEMTVLTASAVFPSILVDGMGCGPENSMTVAMEDHRISVPYLPQITEPTKQDSE